MLDKALYALSNISILYAVSGIMAPPIFLSQGYEAAGRQTFCKHTHTERQRESKVAQCFMHEFGLITVILFA